MNHEDGRRPFLLRRRLSAPETIMRKHLLAQQRSSSQESHKSSDSEVPSGGSDTNLSRRPRQSDIRKSTLMRRFWQNSRGSMNFPNSFAEWQYSVKSKLTSPERRSMRSLLSESPKRAPTLRYSPRRNQSTLSTPLKSDENSYVVYSSNMPESTTNTSRTDSYAVSTHTDTENGQNNNPPQGNVTKAYKINESGISDVTNKAEIPPLPIKYQFVIDDRPNQYEFVQARPDIVNANNASPNKTNLNVITNVQLSQSTLNLIFNQVMQDVLNYPPNDAPPSDTTDDYLQKQKAYNFNLKIDENVNKSATSTTNMQTSERSESCVPDPDELSDKFIGEINVGSPYKKTTSPSVHRLSALPRTSSMEVNISSNDSFEKDSDNSLVDSLEDPSSPRFQSRKHKTIMHDNSSPDLMTSTLHKGKIVTEETTRKTIKKSSVFYIPIDEKKTDIESHVSEHFPSKLKERLLKRQMKREEKRMQERLKQFDIDNGNASTAYFSTSPESSTTHKSSKTASSYKSSKRSTPASSKRMTLPLIDTRNDRNLRSTYTQRSLNRYRDSLDSVNRNKAQHWLPKTKTRKEQTTMTSKTAHSKQTSSSTNSKHIEILEIMEIVEPDRSIHLTPKVKSRIPVLQSSVTKLPKLKPKPSFLDLGSVGDADPKLDQLIANILIDSLNHEQPSSHKHVMRAALLEEHHDLPSEQQSVINNNAIMDENPNLMEAAADILTKQVLDNNNLETPNLVEHMDNVHLDDIPKGWITFYMLQKNQSPESTSDEGARKQTTTKSTQYTNFADESESARDSDSSPVQRRLTRRGRDYSDGWSVTFNRSGNGQEPAPDIEMKFKFPQLSETRKIGSDSKKTKPNIQGRRQGLNFHDACRNNPKSEIDKSRQYLKQPGNGQSNRKRFMTVTPRPTKTSRQRSLLHKQRKVFHNHFQHDDIPEILAINGNAFNQIRRLPKLSEDDLKRLLLSLRQKQAPN